MLVRVGSLGCVTKRCEHCGRIFFSSHPSARHCSAKCRRDFQNERRKRERLEYSLSMFGTGECPVCGNVFRRRDSQHFYCSQRCCEKGQRRGLSFEDFVTPMTDPWTTGRLPEEVTENALIDEGMGMSEKIDMIEYYKNKMDILFQQGFINWVRSLAEVTPSPAEPEEQEGR